MLKADYESSGDPLTAAQFDTLADQINVHTPFSTSVTSAAGTTTLTIADTLVTIVTGSTTQTVKLPTTGVIAGAKYIIDNQSSGTVTVQSSGANTITTLATNEMGVFRADTATPTTAAHWTGFVLTAGKVLKAANSLKFTGTDGDTVNFPSGGGTALVSGGPLGTPSSGTLSSCTGLPVAGITASTSTALGVGSIELGHASDTTISRTGSGDIAVEGNAVYRAGGTDVPVTDGGTGRSTGTTAYGLIAAGTTATGAQQTLPAGNATEILVGGGGSALPVWTTATGSGAPVRATSPTLTTPTVDTLTTTGNIELGHGSDTTISRTGSGDIAVEGNAVYRAGGTDVPVTDGGTGRSTGTTAYGLIAAGTTATGAQQTLPAGATTEILVGGGSSALPAWTTATGSGSPVRGTTPTIATPVLNGTPTGTGVATAATASTLALRDSDANLTADNFIASGTNITSAAGTTTLAIGDTQIQVVTGSTTQTVKLPTTSVKAGQCYLVVNQSSGVVTVQSSGANTIDTVAAGSFKAFWAQQDTPTTAAHWNTIPAHTHADAHTGGQLTPTTALSAAGTPSSSTFLRGDNSWATPTGSGDFSTDTSTSVADEVVLFKDTTGKLGKRATATGIAKLTSGVLSAVTAPSGTIVGHTDTQTLTNKTLSGASNVLGVATKGAVASLPAAARDGNLYLSTDTGGFYYDTGSVQTRTHFSGYPQFGIIPSDVPSFGTAVNSPTSEAAYLDGRKLTAAYNATSQVRAQVRSLASGSSGNYTVECWVEAMTPGFAGTMHGGICLRQSGTTELYLFGHGFTTEEYLIVMKYNSPTSFNSTPFAQQVYKLPYGIPHLLRFRDNGTTLFFEYSYDNDTWATAFSEARTTFLTADQFGYYALANSASFTVTTVLRHVREY